MCIFPWSKFQLLLVWIVALSSTFLFLCRCHLTPSSLCLPSPISWNPTLCIQLFRWRDIWNWCRNCQTVCDSEDPAGRFGNGCWRRQWCSSPKCYQGDIKETIQHSPQGWNSSSWRRWEQRKMNRQCPCLERSIPESWPRNTFWTYSGCKLLRHQRFPWCYRQDCWLYDQGKTPKEVPKTFSIKKDFAEQEETQVNKAIQWYERSEMLCWCCNNVRTTENTSWWLCLSLLILLDR